MEVWALTRIVVLLALALTSFGVGSEGNSSEDGKVLIEFYSESLCPYCANFFVNYLNKFFSNGLIDLVDLRIIPYGNAHIVSDDIITCQHGEDECALNVIQSCAITLWPDVKKWFPFIYCLEDLVVTLPRPQVLQQWKSCAKPAGLDLEPIQACYEGPLGDKLVRGFGAETDSLKPPHQYVPWVLVNGIPLYDDYQNIDSYVCEAYKGSKPKPNVCPTGCGNGGAPCVEGGIASKEKTRAGVCNKIQTELAEI